MAFIAINAKADVAGSKKGKLSPAQNAQLNAWCLAKKTGILDCLDKCTATVQSVINNEATIIFNRGYIVICGRLVECESGTIVKITTPVSGSASGKIILRYSLINSGEDEFTVTTKNEDLIQQDLNDNPINGIYEFELYNYVATPESVTLTRNDTNYISAVEDSVQYLHIVAGNEIRFFNESESDNLVIGYTYKDKSEAGKAIKSYNFHDGTRSLDNFANIRAKDFIFADNTSLNDRLTNLGFKEATISNLNYDYMTSITAFQQGKVVAVQLNMKSNITSSAYGNVGNITGIDLSQMSADGTEIYRQLVGTVSQGGQKYRVIKLNSSGVLTLTYDTIYSGGVPREKTGFYVGILGPHKTMIFIG